MTDGICFVGLDVHARKTVGAAVRLGSGEVFRAQFAGRRRWRRSSGCRALPGPVRAVYEAGPTGFGLARAARAAGIEMMVCSPGAIPRQPGDRIKTDKRDALKLARLHAAGQLRAVLVPELGAGGFARSGPRARGPARRPDGLSASDQQAVVASRHGLGGAGVDLESAPPVVAEPRSGSTTRSSRLVFSEHLASHEALLARRDRLDGRSTRRPRPGPGRVCRRGCVVCAASTR